MCSQSHELLLFAIRTAAETGDRRSGRQPAPHLYHAGRSRRRAPVGLPGPFGRSLAGRGAKGDPWRPQRWVRPRRRAVPTPNRRHAGAPYVAGQIGQAEKATDGRRSTRSTALDGKPWPVPGSPCQRLFRPRTEVKYLARRARCCPPLRPTAWPGRRSQPRRVARLHHPPPAGCQAAASGRRGPVDRPQGCGCPGPLATDVGWPGARRWAS